MLYINSSDMSTPSNGTLPSTACRSIMEGNTGNPKNLSISDLFVIMLPNLLRSRCANWMFTSIQEHIHACFLISGFSAFIDRYGSADLTCRLGYAGLLIYDVMLSLSREIKCIWHYKVSTVTVLYIVVRYGTLTFISLQVLIEFGRITTHSTSVSILKFLIAH